MSSTVSIRLDSERLKRLKKEASVHNKTLGTYLKDLLENWQDKCMEYYWVGAKEYKNGEIFEDILAEHGLL